MSELPSLHGVVMGFASKPCLKAVAVVLTVVLAAAVVRTCASSAATDVSLEGEW